MHLFAFIISLIIFAAIAASLEAASVNYSAAPQHVLYVDPSLVFDGDFSKNCSLQADPCASLGQAMMNVKDGVLNSVRITWLRGLQAAGIVSSFDVNVTSSASWFRVSKLADAELRNTYSHVGAELVVRLPWQCDPQTSDAWLVMQSYDSAPIIVEPDPDLRLLNYSTLVSIGDENNVSRGLLSSSALPQGSVFVELAFPGDSCARIKLPDPPLEYPTYYEQVSNYMVLSQAMIRFLSFFNWNSSAVFQMGAPVQPIGVAGSAGANVTIQQCAFVSCQAAIALDSQFSPQSTPSIYIQRVAALNSSRIVDVSQLSALTQPGELKVDQLIVKGANSLKDTVFRVSGKGLSFILQNSVFNSSTASMLLAVYTISSFTMSNVVMAENSCTSTPVSLNSIANLLITQSSFISNSGSVGAISINPLSSSTSVFQYLLFQSNRAVNSDTTGFSVTGGGAIKATGEGFIQMFNTNFTQNSADTDGGALYVNGPYVVTWQCSFEGNRASRGSGGAIYAESSLLSVQDNTSFLRNSAALSGGCIYVSDATRSGKNGVSLNVNQGASFDGCSAGNDGGVIALYGLKTSSLIKISINNCSAGQSGGAVSAYNSYVTIRQISVSNVWAKRGGVLSGDGPTSAIAFYQSTVSNAFASISGGAIAFGSTGVLVVQESNFTSVSAQIGGFMSLDRKLSDSTPVAFQTPLALSQISQFSSSYVQSNNPSLQRTFVLRNISIDGSMASHFGDLFVCDGEPACVDWQRACRDDKLSISFSPRKDQFMSSPELQFWSGSDPRIIIITGLSLKSLDGTNTSEISVSSDKVFARLYPGQVFSITAELRDYHGNVVQQYANLQVKLDALSDSSVEKVSMAPSGVVVSPQRSVLNGRLRFSNLLVTGEPRYNISAVLQIIDSSFATSASVQVELVGCPLGYIWSKGVCSYCSGPSLYSITPGATSCSICPDNAICDGPMVNAMEGFFLVSSNGSTSLTTADAVSGSVQLLRCPNQFCLGGNKCSSNRGGILCGACREGYSEWQGMCFECKQGQTNGGLVFGWILYLLAMLALNHIGAQSPKSGSIKILYFFAQIFLLIIGPISSSLLGWAKALFGLQLVLSGNSSGVICPFERSSTQRMLTDLFQPIVFVVIVVIFFVPSQLIRLAITLVTRIRRRGKGASAPTEAEPAAVAEAKKTDGDEPGSQTSQDSTVQQPTVSGDMELKERPVSSAVDPVATSPEEFRVEFPEADLDNMRGSIFRSPSSSTAAVRKVSVKIDRKKLVEKLGKKLFKMLFGASTFVRTFFQLLVNSFTLLSTASFQWFNCRRVGDQSVIISATDVSCLSQEYKSLSWLFILGCIYVCAMPIVLFLLLLILRVLGKLDNRHSKRFIGTLYTNYKPWCQWWYEPYALSRRLILVILVVFLGSQPEILWPIILVVLLVFQIVQFVCRPYVNWNENIAEEVSLSALVLISAMNILLSFGNNSQSAALSSSAVSLVVFLITMITVLLTFVANHWITKLVLEIVGVRTRWRRFVLIVRYKMQMSMKSIK